MNLNDLVNSNAGESVNLTVAAYLLSAIVNGLGNQIVEPAVSKVIESLVIIILCSY